MDTEKSILKLQLITLFDSLAFGLIYAFLAPYLLVLGGDNISTGILASSTLLCQLASSSISKDFVKIQGKRDALFTMFSIATVSHMLLVSTGSYLFTIFARCLFSLTNHTHAIIKDMLMDKVSQDEVDFHLTIHNILSSSGFIIGPVVTGCLFDAGFTLSCILAAILSFTCAGLVLAIPKDKNDASNEVPDKSLIEQTAEQVSKTITSFKKSNYHKNWDLITLKFLYITSVSIFFTKFPQILKYNYASDAAIIGYTTSYLNTVMFIATYLADKFKDKYEHIPILILGHQALLILFFSYLVACYAPFYPLFAMACIPIIFSRNYVYTIWDKLFEERKNSNLNALKNVIGIVAGLTAPIFFGLICNIISHHAVILFSVLPIMFSLYILKTYTYGFEVTDDDEGRSKTE